MMDTRQSAALKDWAGQGVGGRVLQGRVIVGSRNIDTKQSAVLKDQAGQGVGERGMRGQ